MRLIATIAQRKNEPECEIWEDENLRVFFTADADIDADGANGQNGAAAAYMLGDEGSDYLANGGMYEKDGKVYCVEPGKDNIAIVEDDGHPRIYPGGVVGCKTSYKDPTKSITDLAAYVDAATVPYIVVPAQVIKSTKGIVFGCLARATYNELSVDCLVADVSSAKKVGELSIAAAEALGINSSPRNGGTNDPNVLYELWPGVPAPGFVLIPSEARALNMRMV
ncbi:MULTISPECIES: glycoside hydrolase family 75 protein [Pseudomonas]|uniref:Uncharacterized protein n=1 Tax=Pseudomonas petroselini TaxID=2899822 RepID=A0ABS8QT18_9PSED|nr:MULTISPECIES: glycoside hydrolase family 75 protein [Pseudomonas]MCD7038825.1 hypothetical protein [Pseudomonas petroselini]MCD7046977.1 hypothetical protein [Pseudomonas petroselini]MCD7067799.1 hypothetical protein [Pseudomonas petroselini]MCD7080243.1 hypothetical protein [Pseudomonas petroselini]MCM2380477.1 glycoside hydrolase family 75 protein [Pseudomonas marginalis]